MELETFYTVLHTAVQYDPKVLTPRGYFNYPTLSGVIGMPEAQVKCLVSALKYSLMPYVDEEDFGERMQIATPVNRPGATGSSSQTAGLSRTSSWR